MKVSRLTGIEAERIPGKEFEGRVRKAVGKMEKSGYNAIIMYSTPSSIAFGSGNVKYLTNYSYYQGTWILLLTLDGQPALFLEPSIEFDLPVARELTKMENIRVVPSYPDAISSWLKQSRITIGKVGIENWRVLPANIFEALRRTFPKISFEPTFIVEDLRQIKSPTEIRIMRKAAQIADISVKASIEDIKVGRRERDVAMSAEFAAMSAGSEALAVHPPLVGSGPRTALVGMPATERKIEAGDLIMIDVTHKYKGYTGDLTRTTVAGRPSEKQKELIDIVREMLVAARRVVKPGQKAGKVFEAARKVAVEAGYERYLWQFGGHGIGLEAHEFPELGPGGLLLGVETGHMILQPNMIVEPEIGLFIQGFGGARMEDMVLVTGSGHEVLTSYKVD